MGADLLSAWMQILMRAAENVVMVRPMGQPPSFRRLNSGKMRSSAGTLLENPLNE